MGGEPGSVGMKGEQGDSIPGQKGEVGAPGVIDWNSVPADIFDLLNSANTNEPSSENTPVSRPKRQTKGEKGEPGHGTQGAQGERGEKGTKGDPGASVTGPQGPPGEAVKGERGEQGEVGLPGPPGPSGEDGESIQGPQGRVGPRGPEGAKGAPGAFSEGTPGIPGTPGKPGQSIKGEKGEPGSGSESSAECCGTSNFVSFHAALTNLEQSHNQAILFNDILNNEQEGYRLKTGHFVAPAAGTYVFHAHVLRARACTIVYFQIVHNHAVVAEAKNQGRTTVFETASATAVVKMVQGDTVWVRLRKGTAFGNENQRLTTFSGHSLHLEETPDVNLALTKVKYPGSVSGGLSVPLYKSGTSNNRIPYSSNALPRRGGPMTLSLNSKRDTTNIDMDAQHSSLKETLQARLKNKRSASSKRKNGETET